MPSHFKYLAVSEAKPHHEKGELILLQGDVGFPSCSEATIHATELVGCPGDPWIITTKLHNRSTTAQEKPESVQDVAGCTNLLHSYTSTQTRQGHS